MVTVHEDLRYRSLGDRDLSVDLYLPEGSARFPVILFAHGGAYLAGEKGGPDSCLLPALARRGVACLDVQYRTCTEADFPAPVVDVARAVEWAAGNADRYGLAPTRIFAGGVSAGAHAAALLSTTRDQQRPCNINIPTGSPVLQGVVGISGIYDLSAYYEHAGTTDFGRVPSVGDLFDEEEGSSDQSVFAAVLGCSYEECPGRYRDVSPSTHASAETPPTLLFHGTADGMLPFLQALGYRDTLSAAGVPVTLVEATGGGHGFSGRSRGERGSLTR